MSTVATGNTLVLTSGQSFSGTVQDGGTIVVSNGGIVTGTTVDGHITVSSGGTVTASTVLGADALVTVLSGGIVHGATVSANGVLLLEGGAVATAISGGSGGILEIGNGYTMSNYVVSASSNEEVLAGGADINAIVQSGSKQYVLGATASGATVQSGGIQDVRSGSNVSGTIVKSGGSAFATSGSIFFNPTVSGGGYIYVDHGSISGGQIFAGGTIDVGQMGDEVGTTILSGGIAFVESGGSADGTTLSGGTETVYGSASHEFVSSGATVKVSGTVISDYISSGGNVIVSSGASYENMFLAGGKLEIQSGAIDIGSNVQFLSSGSVLQIDSQTMPSDSIGGSKGFLPSDVIDLANVGFSANGTVQLLSGNKIEVNENGAAYDLQFSTPTNFTGQTLAIKNDGNGGTDFYLDRAPVETAVSLSTTATHNQSFAATGLFSVNDPDNDSIVTYAFWDTQGNGHWLINGVAQATNQEIDVSAANLSKVTYQAGSGADTLYVRASDGTLTSSWQAFTVTGPQDSAPVASATSPTTSATHNQSFAASSLFSVSDAEHDSIMTYAFWDTQGNGHWSINGVAQATNAEIDVLAANLSQVTYQSGSGSDTLYVRANDGDLWGGWLQFMVTGPLDHAPVVAAASSSIAALEHQTSVVASSLFSATDADGDTITQYGLWDTQGSGHWVVNGTILATNTETDITAAQFAQASYVFGPTGSTPDQLYVRAYDGDLWSGWQLVTASPFTDHAPVVAAVSSSVTASNHQTSIAASSLFSATDADGDTITQYGLWDTQGSGHWVVNGTILATNTETDITAAQFAQASYVFGPTGSTPDQLYVRAYDGTAWGAWQSLTASPFADHAPVVAAVSSSVTASNHQTSITASSLFSATDADGDTITQYGLWDTQGSGHWVVNGTILATNTETDITAAQFAQASYVFGPTGSTPDQLYVRAYDGTAWGAWQSSTASPFADHAPVVAATASNITAAHNQSFSESSLFSATDSDGDSIVTYALWDTQGNGHWSINGVAQATNAEIDVSAANLSHVTYQSGSGADTLYVRANDGTLWGAWQAFTVTGTVDHAPVVAATTASIAATHNQTFAATSLFSVSDTDHDSMVTYAFWDTQGNGRWLINGVAQATNAEIDVPAANLSQVTYQSGAGADTLYVRANDGSLWSGWQAFTVTGPQDQAPVVSASAVAFAHNQTKAASNLFTVSDADNDSIVTYAFMDTQGNGHWVVNGVAQAANVEIDVPAANLSTVTYQSGSGNDTLSVRANDGSLWGAWQSFTAFAPVNQPPVISASNVAIAPTQTRAASSLFTVSDANNDSIVTYAFMDSGTSGHWSLNGVAQANGTEIDVTAANLSQVTYTAGSIADQLSIRASDGTSWGAWQGFTAGPAAPTVSVTVANLALAPGQSRSASSMFTANDPDGNSFVTYAFMDSGSSGHWSLNGVAKPDGTEIDVPAANLSQVAYAAGSATDSLSIKVFDGTLWSNWQTLTAGPVAPTVTAANVGLMSGQSRSASSMFTANDPDGSTLTTYAFMDSGTSGHWSLNGVAQSNGTEIDVTAANLSQVTYAAGAVADQLSIKVFDGTLWSAWQPFMAGPLAPIVTLASPNGNEALRPGFEVDPSTLFSAASADGGTITGYAFLDKTGNGDWLLSGTPQPANTEIDITPNQLVNNFGYVAGTAPDQLEVKVFEGSLSTGWITFSAGPLQPVVTASNFNTVPGETYAASSLFTASDPNPNNAFITTYAFMDSSGNGHWNLNGVAQPSNVELDVDSGNLSQVSYTAGSGSDQLSVRASDNGDWSAWQPFTATGESPAIINAGATLDVATSALPVTFFASTGTLRLDTPFGFTGTVAGMTGSDSIDVPYASFGNQSFDYSGDSSGGTLVMTSPGGYGAVISLLGNYLASTFVASSDGHGGTMITDPPAMNQNNMLTQSQHA